MHPLNPFLRAFFRSALPAQCSPAHHHVLLVPTTDSLSNARDRETNAFYNDLASSEDFLASHVLRVPGGGHGPQTNNKEVPNFRENRGKAKQYSTVNGRTVIVKDSIVYSNKGFKSLNQASLLQDVIYYSDSFEAQAWLIYHISMPLVGTYEKVPIVPALVPAEAIKQRKSHDSTSSKQSNPLSPISLKKKEIQTFGDLLNHFPMISREMQPGLERLFKEFGKEFEKPLPLPPRSEARRPRRPSSVSSAGETRSIQSGLSGHLTSTVSQLEIEDNENTLRTALETAVTAAIDLFQAVDKRQLSNLGATTELTGPVVERMIERYLAEQFHLSVLFPRICNIRKIDDLDLSGRIRQMSDVDITQVGVPIENGRRGKQEITLRIAKAVEEFNKIGVATSPQEMLETLLSTMKIIATQTEQATNDRKNPRSSTDGPSEKSGDILTVNADLLVSLLLMVVIRSSVRHLQARLSYMRHFIFVDDIESGEIGYALSTYEAVLSYLATDAAGLRRSSRRNRNLWEAAKKGNVDDIKAILEPVDEQDGINGYPGYGPNDAHGSFSSRLSASSLPTLSSLDGTTLDVPSHSSSRSSSRGRARFVEGSSLAHVFVFQTPGSPSPPPTPPPELDEPILRPKPKKRVSLETNASSSSGYSRHSRSSTIDSHISFTSGLEGDTAIETLCHTHGPDGDSVLMMAIENSQDASLKFLLQHTEFYPLHEVLEDCNNRNTTLLSAAIQTGHVSTINVLLDNLSGRAKDDETMREYIAAKDVSGRCAAHYLFNCPRLIDRIGHWVPWTLKDKNGQTPLFALCRSYDHEEYKWMVDAAMSAATEAQMDGLPLHLDEHIDGKGNTLLHVVNDQLIALRLLYHTDSDVNAANDRQFTPLMMASKYGRTDLVRALFGDPRVDLLAKDLRGLTAVELAKDDEIRNRIDDLILLANEPGKDGRMTTVVRSFFVEDGTIRFILKSGAPNNNSTITVTTCRRSLADFESLARWLSQEQPASWIPSISHFFSPFLIPSKPSRAILRDIQVRLDHFLKILLHHSTFSTHELVWEFFLVPDIDPILLSERSRRKATARTERVREEYTPIPLSETREIESFIHHARDSIRQLSHSTQSVLRRTYKAHSGNLDLSTAVHLSHAALTTLPFLPQTHIQALTKFANCLNPSDSAPLQQLHASLTSTLSTITALLTALARPPNLIAQMHTAQKLIDRHSSSMRRSDRWPLGLLDDTRNRIQRDASDKMAKSQSEMEGLGRELRYSQEVLAGELASWQDGHGKAGQEVLRGLARRMVVVERARLESMKRAVRGLGLGTKANKGKNVGAVAVVGGINGVSAESSELASSSAD